MRIGLIAVVAVLTACASASPPPGGPEDAEPPKLVRVTPDTNAVNVTDGVVSFYFDETINDRGAGPLAVDSYFLVSPSDGAPRITWRRSRIDVRPRGPFRPNTAYTISLLPGLGDLRGNVSKASAKVVFSTGPEIPPHRIRGIVFDWVGEKPAGLAFMQAVTPDSSIHLAQADSLGRFEIGPLPPGTYTVRAIIDQNSNRSLDRSEAFDSARVTVPQAGTIELLAAVRDTLAARLLTVSADDSVTLRVTFDRTLDPAQTLAPAAFRLLGPDSTLVPIVSVLSPRQERQAAVALAQSAADSARRADSVAGKPLAPIIPPTPRAANAPPPPPAPSMAPPFTALALKLGRALAPNTTYRLSVDGIRGLSGRVVASERSFVTPRPAPRPAADSAQRPAPAAPPPRVSSRP